MRLRQRLRTTPLLFDVCFSCRSGLTPTDRTNTAHGVPNQPSQPVSPLRLQDCEHQPAYVPGPLSSDKQITSRELETHPTAHSTKEHTSIHRCENTRSGQRVMRKRLLCPLPSHQLLCQDMHLILPAIYLQQRKHEEMATDGAAGAALTRHWGHLLPRCVYLLNQNPAMRFLRLIASIC